MVKWRDTLTAFRMSFRLLMQNINMGFPRNLTTLTNSLDPSLQETVFFQTKTITYLGRTGQVRKALKLFEEMPHRNQATWNAMLTVLLQFDHLDLARKMFVRMPRNSISYTLMISGLSKSGFVSEAEGVFNSMPTGDINVISWTAMICCYTKSHQPVDALKLFSSCYGDYYKLNIIPNAHTFSIVIKSCLEAYLFITGLQVSALIVKLLDENNENSVFVQNSLIDLHSKLGKLTDAEKIFYGLRQKDLSSWNVILYTYHLLVDKALKTFNSMTVKDSLSWNIMISGFAEIGHANKALEMFVQLLRSQKPESRSSGSTFTTILTLCATFCMLSWGRMVHGYSIKCGHHNNKNINVANSLINMYAKCGMIVESERVLHDMLKRDVVSWNCLVSGLAENGFCRKALNVAVMAIELGFFNSNTFIGVLTSCSHGGFIDEGLNIFGSMSEKYGVTPTIDHYNCVIDMLGRAGRLIEAHDILKTMPFEANSAAWAALLNGCLIHGNEDVGKVAALKLQELEPNNVSSFVMLANIYVRRGKMEESKQVLSLINNNGLKKDRGCSWVL